MPKVIDETKIFSAALQILIFHGYEGTTTQKIAEVAGVNEVTLFRKYGSKAGLFEKVIEHELADTPLNRLSYTGDLKADLMAIVEAYMETNETHGNIIPLLLIEMPRYPDLQSSFNTPWKNLQGVIKVIQKYQKQGLLMKESPFECLTALIGPILVSQMIRQANLDLPVPDMDPGSYVSSFLNGRRAK